MIGIDGGSGDGCCVKRRRYRRSEAFCWYHLQATFVTVDDDVTKAGRAKICYPPPHSSPSECSLIVWLSIDDDGIVVRNSGAGGGAVIDVLLNNSLLWFADRLLGMGVGVVHREGCRRVLLRYREGCGTVGQDRGSVQERLGSGGSIAFGSCLV